MPYLVHVDDSLPSPPVEIRESDEPGAVSRTEAFRLAKVAAGWEVRTRTGAHVVPSKDHPTNNPYSPLSARPGLLRG